MLIWSLSMNGRTSNKLIIDQLRVESAEQTRTLTAQQEAITKTHNSLAFARGKLTKLARYLYDNHENFTANAPEATNILKDLIKDFDKEIQGLQDKAVTIKIETTKDNAQDYRQKAEKLLNKFVQQFSNFRQTAVTELDQHFKDDITKALQLSTFRRGDTKGLEKILLNQAKRFKKPIENARLALTLSQLLTTSDEQKQNPNEAITQQATLDSATHAFHVVLMRLANVSNFALTSSEIDKYEHTNVENSDLEATKTALAIAKKVNYQNAKNIYFNQLHQEAVAIWEKKLAQLMQKNPPVTIGYATNNTGGPSPTRRNIKRPPTLQIPTTPNTGSALPSPASSQLISPQTMPDSPKSGQSTPVTAKTGNLSITETVLTDDIKSHLGSHDLSVATIYKIAINNKSDGLIVRETLEEKTPDSNIDLISSTKSTIYCGKDWLDKDKVDALVEDMKKRISDRTLDPLESITPLNTESTPYLEQACKILNNNSSYKLTVTAIQNEPQSKNHSPRPGNI
jgi:hypothetical protein